MKLQLKKRLIANKWSFAVLFLVCISYAYQSTNWFSWNHKDKNEHYNILTDGSGYYAYLPAAFIYQDFRFKFLNDVSKKYETILFVNGTNQYAEKNQLVNKYFVGTSLFIAPFFLINHGANKLLHKTADGYSKSYRLSVSLAALFYFALGMIALIYFLNLFKMHDIIIAFCIIALAFGTSLHFYTVYYPSFSHVYSFCAISCFLLVAKKFALNPTTKKIVLLSILLGFIFLLRPTNSIIVFMIPFFFVNWNQFKVTFFDFIKHHKVSLVIAIIIFTILCFVQFTNVYLQIGSFSADTYSQERFEYILNPKIMEVLFGYKKGLFIYAPVLLLLFPATLFLWKQNRFLFIGWISTFALILYITASWWCWWYGGGLGMRPMIDFSLLLILPITLMLDKISYVFKTLVFIFILLCSYVYRTYQIQFNTNILHYENMTSKTFWQCFLKTDFRYAWFVFFQDDELPAQKNIRSEKYYYDSRTKHWKTSQAQQKLDFGIPDKDLDIHFTHHPKSKSTLYAQISGQFWIEKGETNPGFIFDYYQDGKLLQSKNFHIGSRIPRLKTLTPVSCTVKSILKENGYDSLVLSFTRNVRPCGVKDLSLSLYYYE